MCFRRKAILLVHGFVGGIYDFGHLPSELEVFRNFDVYSFTLPGHEKMIVSGVKYDDWIKSAERQVEFLIKNKYKEIYVIGHSMGGAITIHLANKYKEIKKIVLAAPAFRYFSFKDGKVNMKGLKETIKSIPDLCKNVGTDIVIEKVGKTPIKTLIEFTKLIDSVEPELPDVKCPILIIQGLSDNVVPIESTKLIYNSVRSETNILVNVKELTHYCFSRKRKNEVNRIIVDFLRTKQKRKKEIIEI